MGQILSSRRSKHPRIAPPASGAPSLSGNQAQHTASLLPTPRQGASDQSAEPSSSNGAVGATAALTDTSAFNAPAPNPARALVKALKQGDTAKVQELVDANPNELLERRGMWENTPLLVACHYGHSAMALMLLDRGADASAVNEVGCTALLFACNEGMDDLCTRLLSDVRVAVSPAEAMVYSRHTDETNARTPLQAAAEGGFTRGVELLLAKGAPADPKALTLAATRGHAAACAALLSPMLELPPPPQPTAPSAPPLPWLSNALAAAAAGGHEAAVAALCSGAPKAHVAACGGAALRAACTLSGPDAAATGEGSGVRERIMLLLCELGAPADSLDPQSGGSALHTAAARGLRTACTLLMRLPGADPLRPNGAGDSAADLARQAGHSELAETLAKGRAAAAVELDGGGIMSSRPPSGRAALPPLGGAAASAPSVPPSPSPRAEPLPPLPPLPTSPRSSEPLPMLKPVALPPAVAATPVAARPAALPKLAPLATPGGGPEARHPLYDKP